ncbi:MAG: CHAD domain-containing protein [Actinobacteria bacterium]|nr:MAG: CHAD domain-containing protein [Actinomycetota bacterium]
MKARKVKGLDPDAPLGDNAERIVSVRLDEVYDLAPGALDPDDPRSLHDMRIAAKRLRYLLELTAPCFGPYAGKAAKRARELQELAGEVHDCDVMLPRIHDHLARLRAEDAHRLSERYRENGGQEPAALARTPGRNLYRGLELLAAHYQARRELAHERFVVRWREIDKEGMRRRLRVALRSRSPAGATLAEVGGRKA